MNLSSAWIYGRSLAKSLEVTKAGHSFGKFKLTGRVKVEFPRDLYPLGIELIHATPFITDGNLFINVHDIDKSSEIVEFANIRFTKNAFSSAVYDSSSDKRTSDAEICGHHLTENNPGEALKFSKLVCEWGEGLRVWANLNKHYSKDQLGIELSNWLQGAKSQENACLAVTPGLAIKGLGVSFASKHLRLLVPEKFAVLDDVISQGFGFALNPAGYNLFISELRSLQKCYFPEMRVADIEAGLFVLIRQIVRGREAG